MIYIVCRRTMKPEKLNNGKLAHYSEPCRVPVCALRNHSRLGYQVQVLDPETHSPHDRPSHGDGDEVWLHISRPRNHKDMNGLELPELKVGEVIDL